MKNAKHKINAKTVAANTKTIPVCEEETRFRPAKKRLTAKMDMQKKTKHDTRKQTKKKQTNANSNNNKKTNDDATREPIPTWEKDL